MEAAHVPRNIQNSHTPGTAYSRNRMSKEHFHCAQRMSSNRPRGMSTANVTPLSPQQMETRCHTSTRQNHPTFESGTTTCKGHVQLMYQDVLRSVRSPKNLLKSSGVEPEGKMNGTTALPAACKHIWVITGPAGCGKTTVAEHLRHELSFPYLEGDDVSIVALFWSPAITS